MASHASETAASNRDRIVLGKRQYSVLIETPLAASSAAAPVDPLGETANPLFEKPGSPPAVLRTSDKAVAGSRKSLLQSAEATDATIHVTDVLTGNVWSFHLDEGSCESITKLHPKPFSVFLRIIKDGLLVNHPHDFLVTYTYKFGEARETFQEVQGRQNPQLCDWLYIVLHYQVNSTSEETFTLPFKPTYVATPYAEVNSAPAPAPAPVEVQPPLSTAPQTLVCEAIESELTAAKSAEATSSSGTPEEEIALLRAQVDQLRLANTELLVKDRHHDLAERQLYALLHETIQLVFRLSVGKGDLLASTSAMLATQNTSLPTELTNEVFSTLRTQNEMAAIKNAEDVIRRTLFPGTKILSLVQQQQLSAWFGIPNQKWSLLYSATEHGFESKNFHMRCNNKGKTMTIVKAAGGWIFGGFADLPWTSPPTPAFQTSQACWLFTLVNPNNKPEKLPFFKLPEHAMWCDLDCGPTFGGGSDLRITNKCNEFANSYSKLGHTYVVGTAGPNTFTPEKYFKVEDYEVFTLAV